MVNKTKTDVRIEKKKLFKIKKHVYDFKVVNLFK